QPHRPDGPDRQVLHIAASIASGLAYLHPLIKHRDLKPANVLVTDAASDSPLVKIADFGLSRLRSTVAETRNPEIGT
ncbi:Mitogen-activated protein kinase kinase 4, partial [Tetrabaena socialis]